MTQAAEQGSRTQATTNGAATEAPAERPGVELPKPLAHLVKTEALSEEEAREMLAYLLATYEPPPAHFPVASYQEAAPYLRRPFSPAAIRFKVQTAFGPDDKPRSGVLIVSYIDARLVIERLNLVVPHLWHEEFEYLPNQAVACRLTIDGITREDIGTGSGQMALKGARSDALKRTAVHFGVGVSVYAIPQIRLFISDHGKSLEPYTDGKGKHQIRITPHGETKLREGYEKWLAATGTAAFGQPIDHGDVEDSAGEAPESEAQEGQVNDLPAVALPLVDEKADTLRTDARAAYDRLTKVKGGRARMPKATFESNLKQASVSHEELERLIVRVTSLAEESS